MTARKNICPCCGRETIWADRPGGRRLEVVKSGVMFRPAEGGQDLLLSNDGDLVTGYIREDGKEWGRVPHFMVCERARRAMDANRRPLPRGPAVKPAVPEQDRQLALSDVYEGYTRADEVVF